MPAFQLSKWYLDCVTDDGDASIAYVGSAGWGALRLHYSSLLESAGQSVRTRHSLREELLDVCDCSIKWNSNALGVEGEWRADAAAVRETVFESEAGRIEWRCVMPRARVRIGGHEGLGYAEHLSMTIAPWKLPIRTLRWGRFGAASDWVVWIDWDGDYTKRIVYRNGNAVAARRVEDDHISFEDGSRLVMDRSLPIRQGALGTTVLSMIPGIRETFPARLMQVSESKWRSRARLERAGGEVVEGWAIHEVVKWPDP